MRINRFSFIFAIFAIVFFATKASAQIMDSPCDPSLLKQIEASVGKSGRMLVRLENHGTAPLLDPKVYPEKTGINFAQLFTGASPEDSAERAALYNRAAGIVRMAYGQAYFEKNAPESDFYQEVVNKVISGRFQRFVIPCGTEAKATVYKAVRGKDGMTTVQTIRNIVLGYNSAVTIIEDVNGEQSAIQDKCGNVLALKDVLVKFAPIVVPVAPPPPPVTVVQNEPSVPAQPVPPPPPAPAATTTPVPLSAPPLVKEKSKGGPTFTIGAGVMFMKFHTDFTFADPKKGDVPTDNSGMSLVIPIRFDQAPQKGFYASLMATVPGTGKTSTKTFDTATESGVVKKRDTDTTEDKMVSVKVGYKVLRLGDRGAIGVSLDYDHLCLCETYFAQNTNTVNQRSFSTFGIGIEATGSTDSEDHKVTVNVSGTIGIKGTRNKSTTQVYQGPPVINFAPVNDDPEDAKMNRLSGEVDIQAKGPVHIFVQAAWQSWESERQVHTAHEKTSATTAVVGVRLKLGK